MAAKISEYFPFYSLKSLILKFSSLQFRSFAVLFLLSEQNISFKSYKFYFSYNTF